MEKRGLTPFLTVKPIRFFRHVACEPPGYLGACLEGRGYPYEVTCLDEGVAVPRDLDEVAMEMLRQMEASEYEVITVYFGHDVTQARALALAQRIRADYPDQEIEVIEGGQPYYHYILSAE